MPHTSSTHSAAPGYEDLARLNREPVSFLADVAARYEQVPYDAAFYEAQSLLLEHGSSRRIDPASADTLCRRMQEWARSYRGEEAAEG